jgi:hypothetical protein
MDGYAFGFGPAMAPSWSSCPACRSGVQPLTQSWQRGLEQASNWMRRQMQGQGGRWKDHALVWEVHSNESAYVVLGGASASAAFALAGLVAGARVGTRAMGVSTLLDGP